MPPKNKQKKGLEITLKVGDMFREKYVPSQKAQQGKGKKEKKPTGLKGGKGKPARTEKPGVPHGVDLKDQEGVTIIKVAKGGSVHPPKKKRGNYGPNIGKPFKAMGPVGGLPVNKAGTKIMAGVGKLAGRLATRGYGKARK